jgi:hypothetical protein
MALHRQRIQDQASDDRRGGPVRCQVQSSGPRLEERRQLQELALLARLEGESERGEAFGQELRRIGVGSGQKRSPWNAPG